jgi:hypothetical protein
MQGQVVRIHLEAPAGGGRRPSDGSTGPPERLSNIDHRPVKEKPAGVNRRSIVVSI